MIDCLPENSLSVYRKRLYSQSTEKSWILIRVPHEVILNTETNIEP
jgi:hypothetical protein